MHLHKKRNKKTQNEALHMSCFVCFEKRMKITPIKFYFINLSKNCTFIKEVRTLIRALRCMLFIEHTTPHFLYQKKKKKTPPFVLQQPHHNLLNLIKATIFLYLSIQQLQSYYTLNHKIIPQSGNHYHIHWIKVYF